VLCSTVQCHAVERSAPVVVVDISELVHECHNARIEPYDVLKVCVKNIRLESLDWITQRILEKK
jgi:hypothetical protein